MRFGGDLEQVISITKVETKAKDQEIDASACVRQLLSGTNPRLHSKFSCRGNSLSTGVETINTPTLLEGQGMKPQTLPTTHFNHSRSRFWL